MNTGLLTGGNLTINSIDDTTFDISEGSGHIINSYSDPTNPLAYHIVWNTITGITDNYLLTDIETVVMIDVNGNIRQQTTFSEEDSRDYIIIGYLGHTENTVIEYVINEPILEFDNNLTVSDFLNSFGSFNITGNEYYANGNNLRVNVSPGRTFDNAANYTKSKKSPNIITTDLIEQPFIQYYERSSNTWLVSTSSQDIITNLYDTGNGLSSITNGKFTIQPLFYYANLEYPDAQFGQVVYDTMEDAVNNVNKVFDVNPFLYEDTFRTWLIVRSDATDLSDTLQAKFIQAGKFGLISLTSGSGGSGGGEANTASNFGLYGIGLYENKSGVVLQFKNINSSSLTLYDNTIDKTLEINVDDSKINHSNLSSLTTDSHPQYALSFNNRDGISYKPITTVQRLALTASEGLTVYDSDYKMKFYYNGVSWITD